MNDVQQRAAAKHFAEYWNGKGYEKGESQKFWLSLLGDVFGVEHAAEYITFEDQVHLDHTSFIDGYIPETHVLIEQKSIDKDLSLFSDENIEIPRFNPEIYDLLLNKASAAFDWSEISPTIFGAVFESTLNPETRRKGGMHYTSIENIHKVIDPLFLNDLKAELETIKAIQVQRTREQCLRAFQDKTASLRFLEKTLLNLIQSYDTTQSDGIVAPPNKLRMLQY